MQISAKVRKFLAEGDIREEELMEMIDGSAKTRIPGFTRIYYQWLFNIDEDTHTLHDMCIVTGEGDHPMFEEHEECNGKGCRECGGVGSICRMVSNPEI